MAYVYAKYREFVSKMSDMFPDFPNCCYQVSGAAAIIVADAYGLKNIRVTYGTYKQDGVYMPHGWVSARTSAGRPVIIDFAHLQFEPDKLHAGYCSYNQLVHECLDRGVPVPGTVIFSSDDKEFALYEEVDG